MFIRPVDGRLVRDPRSRQVVPETGAFVPDGDPFWTRRLTDGDVTLAQPPADERPAPPPASTEPRRVRETRPTT